MTAACTPLALTATARASRVGGTSKGVSACCAGIWKARATPSTTEIPKTSPRVAYPPCVAATSSKATSACAAMQAAKMRPRCRRSATWPAGRVMSSAGTNWNRPTRPRSQALPVMSYRCQATATSSIWLAAMPPSRASQKRMNGRIFSRRASESSGIG